MEIVRRTLSLSSQPSLTETELAQRAMDWQDSLEAEVPIERLQDAFAGAVRSHSSTFPINAFEILMAWREIASVEQAERRQRSDQERMERERNLPFVPPPDGVLERIDELLKGKAF